MKKKAFLIGLLMITSLAITSSAQTRKSTSKKSTPKTAPTVDTSKTRVRRTGTTPAESQQSPSATEATPEQKPEVTTEQKDETQPKTGATPSVDQVPVEGETKKEEEPEPKVEDPLVRLRDQITAAESGSQRIKLQLILVEELVAAGNKPEALKELHTITNTDVFDPTGFFNTGNAFARLNDSEGAATAYRKAIDQKKGRYSRAYNNLGVVLLRTGRWDEAYAAFNSALKLESFRYPEASYNMGRLYAARGQNDLAVREWRRVLTLNPEHTAARDALAKVQQNDTVELRSVTVASTRVNSERSNGSQVSKPVNSAATETPLTVKTPGAARANKSLVLGQASFDFLQRARTSTEKGNTLDAIENYKRLIKREGGYFAPANLELSFALLSLKRFDEALANLQMVSTRDGSRYPISYFHLARVYEQNGDLKAAEEAFAKVAAAFGSENSQFLLDLSRVREKQGDFNGALQAMEQYIKVMKQQGLEPSWSDERLAALRAKQTTAPKD